MAERKEIAALLKDYASSAPPRLELLIATFGSAGMESVARHAHPRVEGVGYLISWQLPEGEPELPDEIRSREDFKVVWSRTRGVSCNRNQAMRAATAPLWLTADDDLDYSAQGLRELMSHFATYPDTDVAAVRYISRGEFPKVYPQQVWNLARKMPRGWYITAFEMAMRRDAVRGRVAFNERISIGTSEVRCGEEDIFMEDALRARLVCRFFPVTIGAHDARTTGERCASERWMLRSQGAIFSHTHPLTWPLRIPLLAFRKSRASLAPFFPSLAAAFGGAFYAIRHRIFKPDPSLNEPYSNDR